MTLETPDNTPENKPEFITEEDRLKQMEIDVSMAWLGERKRPVLDVDSFEYFYRDFRDTETCKPKSFEEDAIPKSILWPDLDAKVFEEQSWRIKNLIPKQGFVILASISGEKKTWIAMEMAKAIVSGKNFLDEEGFKTEGANVLYLNAENSESEMQRRGRQLGFESQLPYQFYLSNSDDINLNKDEGAVWLRAYIEFYKISVVFVDTFVAVAGGLKEDRSDEVRQFFNRFSILKNAGVVVIFLMHMRKPTNFEGKVPKKEQLLGSQDKSASVEVLLMLSSQAGSEEIKVYQRKNRLGVEIAPFKISMRDNVTAGNKKTILTYEGALEEDANKMEQAQSLILEILENGGRTTSQIIELIKKEVGSKNTRIALRNLTKDRLIRQEKQGKQNYYELPTEKESPENIDFEAEKDNLGIF